MPNKAATRKNRWDQFPLPENGELTPDRLYYAVGVALSQWEFLEEGLSRIFGCILKADSNYSEAAYGAVQTANGRIEMLEAVVNYSCATEFNSSGKAVDESVNSELYDILQKLVILLKTVKHYIARRNEIAHGVVVQTNFNGTDKGYLLRPAKYNIRKNLNPIEWMQKQMLVASNFEDWRQFQLSSYGYNYDSIMFYAQEFDRISIAATNFILYFEFGRIGEFEIS